jgi:hypothetical protein
LNALLPARRQGKVSGGIGNSTRQPPKGRKATAARAFGPWVDPLVSPQR